MTVMKRFLLFVYSTPNIIGSGLGILGLLLFFCGIIKSYWFFIVVGLYLAGYFAAPRSEQINLHMSETMHKEQVIEALNKLVKRVRKRVLPELLARIEAICELIIELLPRVDGNLHNKHIVMQTATDYLPSILEHYLNLPTAFARYHHLKDGSTPRQHLLEQLEVLETQLHKIMDDVIGGDTDALVAHGRFLENKFGNDDDWLD